MIHSTKKVIRLGLDRIKYRKEKINVLGPKFICIGSQKSGTTALYEYLSKHSELIPSKVKELNFFSCNYQYYKGINYYHHFFNNSNEDNKYSFDISPSYLRDKNTPKRIFRYNKNIKLIALLRDPVYRAFSAWTMYKKYKAENNNWFFQYFDKCHITSRKTKFIPRDKNFGKSFYDDILFELEYLQKNKPIEMPILINGNYDVFIKRYLKYFDQSQLFIESNKQFSNNTIKVLENIEQFLDIPNFDWGQVELKKIFNNIYHTKIEEKEIDLLVSYYSASNNSLYHLLNKDFGWLK